jgi:hypothetical protein
MMSKWKSTEVTGAPMTEDYDQQSAPPMHARRPSQDHPTRDARQRLANAR